MTTTTRTETIQRALDAASPDDVADALRKLGNFGKSKALVKVTFVGLTAAAAIDITTAAAKAAATIVGIDLDTGENLPPIGVPISARVTAGAATAGPRHITDVGGTPGAPGANGPGIATLSDDGKTITFEGNVTAFVLLYQPAGSSLVTAAFNRGT